MPKPLLSERLRLFRQDKGLTLEALANLLGVSKVTLVRWESGASKPSPLAAARLTELGFGSLSSAETKLVTTPRSKRYPQRSAAQLRAGVRKTISIAGRNHPFDPSPYVLNGPEDQLPLFETLYRMQETGLSPTNEAAARRLSCIAGIPGLNVTTAQYELESPKPIASHWNSNYGSHGWHRYVGRFPPHVVRALLNHFGAAPGQVLCDPFSGSGTALVEARLLGLRAIGIELNPLSALMSRIKSQFPDDPSKLAMLVEDYTRWYLRHRDAFVGRRSSFSTEDVLARRGNQIPYFENHEKWFTAEALLGCSLTMEFAATLNDPYAREFVALALSSKMRSIGNVDVDVVRAEYRETPREDVDVLGLTRRTLTKMILDIRRMLSTHADLRTEASSIEVIEGSCLDTMLAPHSVDWIITSPPYGVESLSYLRTHLLSYRVLHPLLRTDPYRHDDRMVGSEYLGKAESPPDAARVESLSPRFKEFFSNVECNTQLERRRASMMMKFFDDLVSVAQLFSAWLRPGGRVAFVIGNKRLGVDVIPTDAIVHEVFDGVGLRWDETITHKLKWNNSNSEVPWQDRIIQDEFVMLFRRS